MKMKIKGRVRKIDKIGRIVLPKEILRDLNIQKGDVLNIYLDGKDMIVLEKNKDNIKK